MAMGAVQGGGKRAFIGVKGTFYSSCDASLSWEYLSILLWQAHCSVLLIHADREDPQGTILQRRGRRERAGIAPSSLKHFSLTGRTAGLSSQLPQRHGTWRKSFRSRLSVFVVKGN